MRGDVHPFAFFVFCHAQADEQVNQFVADEGDDTRPDDGQADGGGLGDELIGDRVVVGDLVGDVVIDPRAAQAGGGEYGGEQCTRMPPTPCTPNTSSVSSAPSRRFKPWTTPQAQCAAEQADHQRAADADKAAGRGNGNQTGDGTGSRAPSREGFQQPFEQHP